MIFSLFEKDSVHVLSRARAFQSLHVTGMSKKENETSQGITSQVYYFLLKYKFHAGFVTSHNSQQNKETSLDPPAGFMTLGNEVFLPRFPMCKFLMAI